MERDLYPLRALATLDQGFGAYTQTKNDEASAFKENGALAKEKGSLFEMGSNFLDKRSLSRIRFVYFRNFHSLK